MPRNTMCRRKVTPKVIGGKAQRKNRWATSPNCETDAIGYPQIVRKKPGKDFRHLIRQRDLKKFITLLPDWGKLSIGLNAIILDEGNYRRHGWHRRGIVAVCAWDRDIQQEWTGEFYREHHEVLERLKVPCHRMNDEDNYRIEFTEETARGFQLMHILLHELGHHHDRMTTKAQNYCGRGERFAETYANLYARSLWEKYETAFVY